jgi:ankyrin repeat protein
VRCTLSLPSLGLLLWHRLRSVAMQDPLSMHCACMHPSASSTTPPPSAEPPLPSPDVLPTNPKHAGDSEGISKALAAGAKVDAFNEDGVTPLHLAACSGGPEAHTVQAVRQLCAAGARVDRGREQDERTALHCVCDEAPGFGLPVASALIEAGCNPDARDIGQWTPMHCACYMGAVPYVQLLLEHGAEVGGAHKPLLHAQPSQVSPDVFAQVLMPAGRQIAHK